MLFSQHLHLCFSSLCLLLHLLHLLAMFGFLLIVFAHHFFQLGRLSTPEKKMQNSNQTTSELYR
eukprot:m.205293 g.205293  ORF g.205293 m.205293 type:complete len:64 (-) comp16894_c3_seq5:6912-7103(-)